jgi:hypothetical protein
MLSANGALAGVEQRRDRFAVVEAREGLGEFGPMAREHPNNLCSSRVLTSRGLRAGGILATCGHTGGFSPTGGDHESKSFQ